MASNEQFMKYVEAIENVLSLHKPHIFLGTHKHLVCSICTDRNGHCEDYPCPTIKAIVGEQS